VYSSNSRYAGLETAHLDRIEPDGQVRTVAYTRRRFIPPLEGQTTLVEHRVTQGERLDRLAARYLGDPTQFWRICDANLVLAPNELTDDIGRSIAIALPFS
jgi:hypothetical protein